MGILKTTFGLAIVCALSAQPAHAYLDPGNGSFLFQILIGAVLAASYSAKLYAARIKVFLSSLFTRVRDKKSVE